jgi:hypothetical protein
MKRVPTSIEGVKGFRRSICRRVAVLCNPILHVIIHKLLTGCCPSSCTSRGRHFKGARSDKGKQNVKLQRLNAAPHVLSTVCHRSFTSCLSGIQLVAGSWFDPWLYSLQTDEQTISPSNKKEIFIELNACQMVLITATTLYQRVELRSRLSLIHRYRHSYTI